MGAASTRPAAGYATTTDRPTVRTCAQARACSGSSPSSSTTAHPAAHPGPAPRCPDRVPAARYWLAIESRATLCGPGLTSTPVTAAVIERIRTGLAHPMLDAGVALAMLTGIDLLSVPTWPAPTSTTPTRSTDTTTGPEAAPPDARPEPPPDGASPTGERA